MDTFIVFDIYFSSRKDALGVQGFFNTQKCTSTLKMLTYGMVANLCN
jgi:hypothetical protein